MYVLRIVVFTLCKFICCKFPFLFAQKYILRHFLNITPYSTICCIIEAMVYELCLEKMNKFTFSPQAEYVERSKYQFYPSLTLWINELNKGCLQDKGWGFFLQDYGQLWAATTLKKMWLSCTLLSIMLVFHLLLSSPWYCGYQGPVSAQVQVLRWRRGVGTRCTW